MRRRRVQSLVWPLAFGLLASGLAGAGPADARERREMRPAANPSALIATELAFATLAQDKGQWTAFRETAAVGAEMFVPQRVVAATFLKDRADPPVAVKWQPFAAWTSCDGTYGVTRGAWQLPTTTGYFTTVWQRQKKGDFRWVLDQGDALAAPLAAPEFIEGKVADCTARPRGDQDRPDAPPPRKTDAKGKAVPPPPPPLPGPVPPLVAPAGADSKDGRSDDGTLVWRSVVAPDNARDFTVWMWKDGQMREVLHSVVAPPPQG